MGAINDAVGTYNPTSDDPNGGLSDGQMFARKAIAGGLAGAGNALQSEASGGPPKPVDFSKLGGNVKPAQPKLPYQVDKSEVPQIPTPGGMRPRKLYQDDQSSQEYQ